MRDVAPNRAAIAHRRITDDRRGVGQRCGAATDVGGGGQLGMGGQRADPQHVANHRDAAELRHPADVDHGRRRGKPQFHQRNQAVAAGEQLCAWMRAEHAQRVFDGARAVIVEIRGVHRYAPSLCMARHTRSGVHGI